MLPCLWGGAERRAIEVEASPPEQTCVDAAAVGAAVAAAAGRDHQRIHVEVEEVGAAVEVELRTTPYGGSDQARLESCQEATDWTVAAAVAMLRAGARGCTELRAASWVDLDPWIVAGAAGRFLRWQGRPSWAAVVRAGYGVPLRETTLDMARIELQVGLGPVFGWPLAGGTTGPPGRIGLSALGRIGLSSVSWQGHGSDQSPTYGAEAGVEFVSRNGFYAAFALAADFGHSVYVLSPGGPPELEAWWVHPTAEIGWTLLSTPLER